jgi:two-component system response regulator
VSTERLLRSVLLVEDDAAHAEITRRNLEATHSAGRQVVHVSDGQAALDYLRHEGAFLDGSAPTPDLVLLDLRLPKVSGLEVLRRVKDDPRLKTIPVVVLTTSRAATDVVAAYERGASSYLVKPMDPPQFAELMAAFGTYWLEWNQFRN